MSHRTAQLAIVAGVALLFTGSLLTLSIIGLNRFPGQTLDILGEAMLAGFLALLAILAAVVIVGSD